MVKVELCEKLILNIVPEDYHLGVHKVFLKFKEDRIGSLSSGWNHFASFFNGPNYNKNYVADAIAFGIILGRISEDPEGQKIFKDSMEAFARDRGENIISYLDKKITKRR